ncbi:MAG: hypothetical protein IAE78_24565 [Myxococcus sp.]|nr:hypothetical protein [Myxococcus sp.]
MSKHHKHHPHGPPHKRHASSAVTAFIDADALGEALTPWLPAAADREFVLRCVLDEGPAHHRGSNYVLLSLLAKLAQRLGAQAVAPGPQRTFEMRLPPHLEDEIDERAWPVGVPEGVFDVVAPGDPRAAEAMTDCLTDGPPQHAVANVLMAQLLASLLAQVPERP